MKKPYLILGALMTLITIQATKADTISLWNFDSLTLSTANTNATPNGWVTNVTADAGSGTASSFHATTTAVFSTPAGAGASSKSLSANNWTTGDYFQFVLSTTGYEDIQVSYAQYGSSTGPRDFYFQYSTDGINFTTVGLTNSLAAASTWYTNTYDLSAISALDDASAVYFRVVDASATAINGSAVATTGTDRLDLFTVTGAPVPEPSSIALAAMGGLACLVAVRRRK